MASPASLTALCTAFDDGGDCDDSMIIIPFWV
jgi:hypothetical protein